ncbi:MAG: hypothetical protein HOV80_08840 [Polyangiaceae bacterium]|nr:hypothetical protein [Polyangiaceae bacterium]
MNRASLFLFAAALLSASACDGSKTAAPTATASSAPPPTCNEKLPMPDRIARCEKGEALCCTAMMTEVPKDAPDYWDKLKMACGGGAETSCEIIRGSDRAVTYKMEAFAKACTIMGRWPCRTAAMLAVLAAPDRAKPIIENYCRQTDDNTFRIALESFKCDPFDPKQLERVDRMAKGCRGGNLNLCKLLAGVDGNARELFYDVAWEARGIRREDAEKKRVRPTELRGAEPKGKVAIKALDDKGAVDAGRSEHLSGFLVEPLRGCVGWALESNPKAGGRVRYLLFVDKTSQIAATEVVGKNLEDTSLSECLRGTLQDAIVLQDRPGYLETWTIDVTISP